MTVNLISKERDFENHYNTAREEITFYGPENTSLQNFLAILIGPKADPSITGQLAGLGVQQLSELTLEELKKFKGIGDLTAQRIHSSLGLAKFIRKSKERNERYVIRSPEDGASFVSDLSTLSQEHFVVLYLNTKNHVIHRKTVFIGSLNASVVHPREVFREAVRQSAASIICAHNHPSGDSEPSQEDIHVTRRLAEAGKMIGIELLDHLIIGNNQFTSLKEKGLV